MILTNGISIINEPSSVQRQPISGHNIGRMDVLDRLFISFDIEIHSFPSSDGLASIMYIGNTNTDRYPAIYIETQSTVNRFRYVFCSPSAGDSDTNLISYTPHISLNTSVKYHLTFNLSQTNFSLQINPINNVYSFNVLSHSIALSQYIWIASPWDAAADATISALQISTENENYNYLCDYENRFTEYNGTWSTQGLHCSVNQLNVSDIDVDTISWLTDKSIEWRQYTVEAVITADWNKTSDPWAQQYVGILVQQKSNDTYFQWTMNYQGKCCIPNTWMYYGYYNKSVVHYSHNTQLSSSFDKSQEFTFTIQVNDNNVTCSLNDGNEFSDMQVGNKFGSVGLYTRNVAALFKSLKITFESDGFDNDTTDSPTQYPTMATLDPTYQPTYGYPTTLSTLSIDDDFELFGVLLQCEWNATSNQSFYLMLQSDENIAKLADIMTHIIHEEYDLSQSDIDEISIKFVALNGTVNSSTLEIRYNVTNFDKVVNDLHSFLESESFGESIKNQTNMVFYSNSTKNHIAAVQISVTKYHSFLIEPLDFSLSFANPVTLVLFCLFLLLFLMMLLGITNNRFPEICNKYCKIEISDNFYVKRFLLFFAVSTGYLINVNSIYCYLYYSDVYANKWDIGFLMLFISAFIISFIIMSLHQYDTRYKLKKTLTLIKANNEYVNRWIDSNMPLLVTLNFISSSLPTSLNLVNCNLFHLKVFRMSLTDHQIAYYGIVQYKFIFLGALLSLIHFIATIYVFGKYEIKYEANITLHFSMIFSLIYGTMSIIGKFISSSYSNKSKKYNVVDISMNIDVDDCDLELIKSKKYLYRKPRQMIAEILRVMVDQIDIKNCENTSSGIVIQFMCCELVNEEYVELIDSYMLMQNECDDYYTKLDLVMGNKSIHRQIKDIYKLNQEPLNITYSVNDV